MSLRDLELLDAWRHGRLSEAEFAALQDRLRDDAALRAALRELAEVEDGLSALALAKASEPLTRPKLKAVTVRSNWLSWGMSAAAGILIGSLCSSVVFGYVMLGVEKAVMLLQESFESAAVPVSVGFPSAAGVWGGDEARVVVGDGMVKGKDGAQMQRMEPVTTDLWNRQFFMIDLTKLPVVRNGRRRVVGVKASFHASASEIRDRYLARAAAFAEAPELIRPEWMTTMWGSEENRALTMAAKAETFSPGTEGWQTLALTLDVPQGSRVLVISFWAATMHGKAEMRAPHFLDDVCVSLETLPSTPR